MTLYQIRQPHFPPCLFTILHNPLTIPSSILNTNSSRHHNPYRSQYLCNQSSLYPTLMQSKISNSFSSPASTDSAISLSNIRSARALIHAHRGMGDCSIGRKMWLGTFCIRYQHLTRRRQQWQDPYASAHHVCPSKSIESKYTPHHPFLVLHPSSINPAPPIPRLTEHMSTIIPHHHSSQRRDIWSSPSILPYLTMQIHHIAHSHIGFYY